MNAPRCRPALLIPLLGTLLAAPPAKAQVQITEVQVATRQIEVTNFGVSSVNLANWSFCARFSYTALGGSIAAGETRLFTLAGLNTTSSDLGLYSNSSFASTSAMQDFLQWGGSGIGRESVAVSKGIWTAGGFFAVPAAGFSYHARGLAAAGVRNGNWFVARPFAGLSVPPMVIESAAVSGGEWQVVLFSYFVPGAHHLETNPSLSPAASWQEVTPTSITDLGGGRYRYHFPAIGSRSFSRFRALY